MADFVTEIERRSGITIRFDRKAAEDAGVSADAPVTCSLKSASLRAGLKASLSDLGLIYFVKDGILTITSRDVAEAEENLSTRVYPIGDIDGGDVIRLTHNIVETAYKNTWDENGGVGKIEPAAGSRCLIISQTDEVHFKVLGLLRALRIVHKLWPYEAPPVSVGRAVVGQE